MDVDLTDTERMLRDTFRAYFTARDRAARAGDGARRDAAVRPLMRQMHQRARPDQMMASIGGGGEGAAT